MKTLRSLIIITISVVFFFLSGCDLHDTEKDGDTSWAPYAFDFSTTTVSNFNIIAETPDGIAGSDIVGAIYNGNPEEGGSLLQNFQLEDIGRYTFDRSIPKSVDEIYARLNYNQEAFYFSVEVLNGNVKLHVIFDESADTPVIVSQGTTLKKRQMVENAAETPKAHFVAHYPGEGRYGILLFEDLWPSFGDYDLNDLVVEYNVREKLNPANMLLGVDFTFVIRAVGASFNNGFAVSFDELDHSLVKSVTGQSITENYIQLRNNGTEDGSLASVIIVADNISERMPGFSNVIPGVNTVDPDTLTISVSFNQAVNRDLTGFPPYNPFIIANGQRGREVHLPNHVPTILADMSLFNTIDDDSNIEDRRFYRSRNNLNWAIHIPEAIPHAISGKRIYEAYPLFRYWAESNGTKYNNWYQDLPGHRNYDNLIQIRN